MHAKPLPEGLAGGPFSTARARELGVGPSRLRRAGLVHPTRGAHAVEAPVTLTERAAAFAAGMPSARAFSHLTAARLLGLPLPGGLAVEADAGALHVMAHTDDGQVRRKGCVGHRGLEIRATSEVDGLQVVDPAHSWVDLGELRCGRLTRDDLVVLGDAAVALLDSWSGQQVRSGARTSAGVRALHEALHGRVRPRGKVMLAHALEVIRPRVRSPMETRARLMFVRAGFPEPEAGGLITDEDGEFLAEGDLVWRARRVVAEYQGAHHAEIGRRSADSGRRHLLERSGWQVRELFAEDVYRAPRRQAALEAVAAMLGLDPSTLHIT
ncbi:hypothetical protein ACOCJ5_01520 [Knoellia sp. CPCC 206450]|uniref:hypothetical protein n=1 Tax=Knoellia tibetensis TaxID=3404798 RepID=UPI003B437F6C